MPTASLVPTYYRVTFAGNAPTDYNALGGDSAGGVDNCLPERYMKIIRITGNQANPTVTAGHTVLINGVIITFTAGGGVNLAGIISTINALTTEHKVRAVESPATYLTLINASGWEGYNIDISAGSGTVLADTGITAGIYSDWPSVVGGATSLPLTDQDDILFNGVKVTFTTAGGLDQAGVVSTINSMSALTNVSAQAGAGTIILSSVNGQPFSVANGVAGACADIGFAAGNYGGSANAATANLTYTQSMNKERANMRWDQIVNELGMLISPVFLGEVVKEFKDAKIDATQPLVSMAWTVGYDRANFLQTEDELNAGVMLMGAACVKRLVARALVDPLTGNQEIFDPTITTVGNTCVRLNPSQIQQVTAGAIDAPADLAVVEANISVVQIAQV